MSKHHSRLKIKQKLVFLLSLSLTVALAAPADSGSSTGEFSLLNSSATSSNNSLSGSFGGGFGSGGGVGSDSGFNFNSWFQPQTVSSSQWTSFYNNLPTSAQALKSFLQNLESNISYSQFSTLELVLIPNTCNTTTYSSAICNGLQVNQAQGNVIAALKTIANIQGLSAIQQATLVNWVAGQATTNLKVSEFMTDFSNMIASLKSEITKITNKNNPLYQLTNSQILKIAMNVFDANNQSASLGKIFNNFVQNYISVNSIITQDLNNLTSAQVDVLLDYAKGAVSSFNYQAVFTAFNSTINTLNQLPAEYGQEKQSLISGLVSLFKNYANSSLLPNMLNTYDNTIQNIIKSHTLVKSMVSHNSIVLNSLCNTAENPNCASDPFTMNLQYTMAKVMPVLPTVSSTTTVFTDWMQYVAALNMAYKVLPPDPISVIDYLGGHYGSSFAENETCYSNNGCSVANSGPNAFANNSGYITGYLRIYNLPLTGQYAFYNGLEASLKSQYLKGYDQYLIENYAKSYYVLHPALLYEVGGHLSSLSDLNNTLLTLVATHPAYANNINALISSSALTNALFAIQYGDDPLLNGVHNSPLSSESKVKLQQTIINYAQNNYMNASLESDVNSYYQAIVSINGEVKPTDISDSEWQNILNDQVNLLLENPSQGSCLSSVFANLPGALNAINMANPSLFQSSSLQSALNWYIEHNIGDSELGNNIAQYGEAIGALDAFTQTAIGKQYSVFVKALGQAVLIGNPHASANLLALLKNGAQSSLAKLLGTLTSQDASVYTQYILQNIGSSNVVNIVPQMTSGLLAYHPGAPGTSVYDAENNLSGKMGMSMYTFAFYVQKLWQANPAYTQNLVNAFNNLEPVIKVIFNDVVPAVPFVNQTVTQAEVESYLSPAEKSLVSSMPFSSWSQVLPDWSQIGMKIQQANKALATKTYQNLSATTKAYLNQPMAKSLFFTSNSLLGTQLMTALYNMIELNASNAGLPNMIENFGTALSGFNTLYNTVPQFSYPVSQQVINSIYNTQASNNTSAGNVNSAAPEVIWAFNTQTTPQTASQYQDVINGGNTVIWHNIMNSILQLIIANPQEASSIMAAAKLLPNAINEMQAAITSLVANYDIDAQQAAQDTSSMLGYIGGLLSGSDPSVAITQLGNVMAVIPSLVKLNKNLISNANLNELLTFFVNNPSVTATQMKNMVAWLTQAVNIINENDIPNLTGVKQSTIVNSLIQYLSGNLSSANAAVAMKYFNQFMENGVSIVDNQLITDLPVAPMIEPDASVGIVLNNNGSNPNAINDQQANTNLPKTYALLASFNSVIPLAPFVNENFGFLPSFAVEMLKASIDAGGSSARQGYQQWLYKVVVENPGNAEALVEMSNNLLSSMKLSGLMQSGLTKSEGIALQKGIITYIKGNLGFGLIANVVSEYAAASKKLSSIDFSGLGIDQAQAVTLIIDNPYSATQIVSALTILQSTINEIDTLQKIGFISASEASALKSSAVQYLNNNASASTLSAMMSNLQSAISAVKSSENTTAANQAKTLLKGVLWQQIIAGVVSALTANPQNGQGITSAFTTMLSTLNTVYNQLNNNKQGIFIPASFVNILVNLLVNNASNPNINQVYANLMAEINMVNTTVAENPELSDQDANTLWTFLSNNQKNMSMQRFLTNFSQSISESNQLENIQQKENLNSTLFQLFQANQNNPALNGLIYQYKKLAALMAANPNNQNLWAAFNDIAPVLAGNGSQPLQTTSITQMEGLVQLFQNQVNNPNLPTIMNNLSFTFNTTTMTQLLNINQYLTMYPNATMSEINNAVFSEQSTMTFQSLLQQVSDLSATSPASLINENIQSYEQNILPYLYPAATVSKIEAYLANPKNLSNAPALMRSTILSYITNNLVPLTKQNTVQSYVAKRELNIVSQYLQVLSGESSTYNAYYSNYNILSNPELDIPAQTSNNFKLLMYAVGVNALSSEGKAPPKGLSSCITSGAVSGCDINFPGSLPSALPFSQSDLDTTLLESELNSQPKQLYQTLIAGASGLTAADKAAVRWAIINNKITPEEVPILSNALQLYGQVHSDQASGNLSAGYSAIQANSTASATLLSFLSVLGARYQAAQDHTTLEAEDAKLQYTNFFNQDVFGNQPFSFLSIQKGGDTDGYYTKSIQTFDESYIADSAVFSKAYLTSQQQATIKENGKNFIRSEIVPMYECANGDVGCTLKQTFISIGKGIKNVYDGHSAANIILDVATGIGFAVFGPVDVMTLMEGAALTAAYGTYQSLMTTYVGANSWENELVSGALGFLPPVMLAELSTSFLEGCSASSTNTCSVNFLKQMTVGMVKSMVLALDPNSSYSVGQRLSITLMTVAQIVFMSESPEMSDKNSDVNKVATGLYNELSNSSLESVGASDLLNLVSVKIESLNQLDFKSLKNKTAISLHTTISKIISKYGNSDKPNVLIDQLKTINTKIEEAKPNLNFSNTTVTTTSDINTQPVSPSEEVPPSSSGQGNTDKAQPQTM